jgi:hypothetical protein
MDAKAAYVACSRGRHQASVFTPDKAHLLQRVEQSGDRLAASEVLNLPAASLRHDIWRQQERQAWRRVVDHALVLQTVSRKPERERELLPPSEVSLLCRREPVTRMEISL